MPHTAAFPFFSVIINCYNGATYLTETLNSVLAQSFDDWEIIFWDNRSTDDSAAIFKSHTDKRFKYYLAPTHLHLAAAKRLAIENSNGKWLALLDADDLWMPDKLTRQAAIIARSGSDLGLVYGKMRILVEPEAKDSSLARRAVVRENEITNEALPEGAVFEKLLQGNFIPQPSIVIRKSCYYSVGGIDDQLRHSWDYDISLKISKEFKVSAVQDFCCTYRIHGSNLSYSQVNLSFEEPIAIVGRYLPAPAAIRGLRSIQASYAGHDIRNGKVLEGISRLIQSGAVLDSLRKLTRWIRRNVLYIAR